MLVNTLRPVAEMGVELFLPASVWIIIDRIKPVSMDTLLILDSTQTMSLITITSFEAAEDFDDICVK